LLGINTGQGQLVGEYVDLTGPGIPGYKPTGQADEASHVYDYPCNDDRFEEVNVYYHADRVQRLVQSLGFTGASAILDTPLPANAHWDGSCNAYYLVGSGIVFGDATLSCGGIPAPADFAEDSDVVVHEYGHALQDAGISGWFSTDEGRALGEGFADFLATVMFEDPCIFNWRAALGHVVGITCIRNVETGANFNGATLGYDYYLNYPDGLTEGEHEAGLVWSGALWDTTALLGGDQAARETVLAIVLQSHFSLGSSSVFTDAAQALLDADAMLYAGAHTAELQTALTMHSICWSVCGSLPDGDGDGCIDENEIGSNPAAGGLRDPDNYWDFYDVGTGSPVVPGKDGVVDLKDTLLILMHFGHLYNGGAYVDPGDDDLDRSVPDSLQPWRTAEANNGIDLVDALNSLKSFGHNCN
jgi:hypothetical protein